jgi:hypothetical protein
LKNRLLNILLAGMLIALIIVSAPHATAYQPPQTYLTVSLQPTPDPAVGKAQVDTAYAAGFNSIRVIMPWTYPGQAEVNHDWPRLCTLASEASDLRMALFLDLVPPPGKNPKPPVTSSQITKYDKTLSDYMMYLIGPNGCAKSLAELDIQVANEPNYSVFWPQAYAPEEYTHLAIRTYKFVHQMADKAKFKVPVKVVVGELAASHDMKSFMDRMHDEAQKWNYHGPFFDMFSYHCYGTGTSQQPTSPDDLQDWLVADFGQAVPLLCTEYAVATSARSLPSAERLSAQSENLQAKLFCQTVSMVSGKGLAGIGWFRLFDDPSGALTGLYYYDPALGRQGHAAVAKSSLKAASQCLASASASGS